MKSLGFFSVAVIALAVSGCTCRTAAGPGDQLPPNVPAVVGGGPLKDINFAFDSYKLDTKAKAILDENASWLQKNADASVEIGGHCDERGTNEYNDVLGANRARAAYDYLRNKGIDKTRMRTNSYGENVPVDQGHNEEAWAKNRRDHFEVTSK